MKKLMMLFMGLLFMGSLVLTSCDKDDDIATPPDNTTLPIEFPEVEHHVL
ncbi:hypothetical protein [Maribellus mangrovi]